MVRPFPVTAFIAAAVFISASASSSRADVVFQNAFSDSAGTGFFDPTFGAERQAAFVAAENIWSGLLVSSYATGDEVITVSASFSDLGGTSSSAIVGSAQPTTFPFDFVSSNPKYEYGTVYAAALANHLAGTNLEGPGASQISASFNSNIDSGTIIGGKTFYYGTDGNAPNNTIDFETIALHEITHGLGFISSIQANGSFAMGIFHPDAFDNFLYRGATGEYLVNDGTNGQRALDVTSNDLYFRGPDTMALDGPNGAKLYAPSSFIVGSSASHIDPSLSDLLNPSYSGPDHMPSLTDLAILSDMGWDVSVPAPEPASLGLLAGGALLLLRRRRR